jgi:hypothetical protein
MEFRLTYEGILLGSSSGNPRGKHKHEVRRVFHKQLRRFWDIHPYLREASLSHRTEGRVFPEVKLLAFLHVDTRGVDARGAMVSSERGRASTKR